MLRIFYFPALLAISFSMSSCHTDQEKKNETPAVQNAPVTDFVTLEKKLEDDSLNNELRITLALKYYSAGELNKAEFHFLKVVALDNKNQVALSNLGNIYYDSQQDDKAIEFYGKALEKDSANINMRCDLATCYANINKMKKAIQILKENIKLDASHAKSHYNLSVILLKNGNTKEADDEMKIYKSLTQSPK